MNILTSQHNSQYENMDIHFEICSNFNGVIK